MREQEALNFCNQYLMLKIIAETKPPQKLKHTQSYTLTPKKKNKVSKFENPKKIQSYQQQQMLVDQPSVKTKTKKKKFETVSNINKHQTDIHEGSSTLNQNKHNNDGFVPIDALINELAGNKTERKNKADNNFMSFGPEQNHYQSKSSINYDNQNKHNYSSYSNLNDVWGTSNNQKMSYNEWWLNNKQPISYTGLMPSRSQYLYESPMRNNIYAQQQNRSRSRSPLTNCQSISNLSMANYTNVNNNYNNNNNNRSFNVETSTSASKKKRKGERQFYIPISVNVQKQQISNNNIGEVSRVSGTSKILSKLQRQIMQQQQQLLVQQQQQYQQQQYTSMKPNRYNSSSSLELAEKYKQKQKQKERKGQDPTRYTNRNTNSNITKTIIKQMDQFSMIQLDHGVRQSLSFVSQVGGMAMKPINIQLEK